MATVPQSIGRRCRTVVARIPVGEQLATSSDLLRLAVWTSFALSVWTHIDIDMRIIDVYAEDCLLEMDVGNPVIANVIVIEHTKSATRHSGLGNLQGYFLVTSIVQDWSCEASVGRGISRVYMSAVGIQQIRVEVLNLAVGS